MLFEIGLQQQMQGGPGDSDHKEEINLPPVRGTSNHDNKVPLTSMSGSGSNPNVASPRGVNPKSGLNPNEMPRLTGDAAILAVAFQQLKEGGLTLSERKKLGTIDAVLSEADIMVNKAGDGATIVDRDGNTTNLGANRKGRGK